jgi:hypothetical protein
VGSVGGGRAVAGLAEPWTESTRIKKSFSWGGVNESPGG